ncbi:hypothetical protein JG687_00008519 [Phytophthora cactorum]|uniref:Uncharacterized protein n=1 Tax=Phytophthora cactorum TaxID=29920 RepID=A0A8T1UEK0_9STRA|nr:hypothetical protein JG687_00008519 [Phytophthora cactorum]
MRRASNAFGIHHSHMEWREGGGLQIYFGHVKNDQGCDRPRNPRYIYAIPLQPVICLIVALRPYWASLHFDGSDLLFPAVISTSAFGNAG